MSEPVTTKAPGRRRMYLLVRMLCEGGLMIALALVLGLLKVFELPQGGSISLEMLPLLFFCVRWGMGGGFIACFAFGVLQVFIQGAVSWGWQSILLDYVLAFSFLGLACAGLVLLLTYVPLCLRFCPELLERLKARLSRKKTA